jgi:ferredoxin
MNLIQLALAAEEFFRQQPVIQLTEAQCVRAKDVHAACDRCVVDCPTGAIQLEDGLPTLTPAHCIKCGICLHTCPVGVFERADGLHKLLHCAETIAQGATVAITCAHHPDPQLADPGVDTVIQVDNCLSTLGPSAYIGLLAVGVKAVRVRLDACAECPLRVLNPQIEDCVANTQRILNAFASADRLTAVHHPDTTWRQRPLHQSQNPPVSRRGFFSMLTPQTESRARRIVPVNESMPEAAAHPSRERQRLLTGLRTLAERTSPLPEAVFAADGFARFTVSEDCTACGLCERVCPTGALHVLKQEEAFTIAFAPDHCTACDLCVGYCEPGALQAAGGPSAAHVLDGCILALYEGQLQQCSRCKTRFAGQPDTLCPVCRYRRDNPTGIRLPETLLAKLPEATRQRLMQSQTGTISPGAKEYDTHRPSSGI